MDTTEVTIKKMLLNATLEANLVALKFYTPKIYEEFKDYEPTSSGVVIDDEGNIDLYNNKQYVYGGQPEKFSRVQLSQFLDKPLYFDLKMEEISDENARYEHQRILNEIKRTREKETVKDEPFNESRLDFVCMVGAGLGYQVQAMFEQKEILHFLLCEPSKDIFFAMLHCLELKPLFEHCIKNGGSFNIMLGNTDVEMLNSINGILLKSGRFYLPRFYFYKHYDSITTDASLSLLQALGYRLAFGFGFMEDEAIGFRHTLANLKLGYKVCKKPTEFINHEPNRPVFIVANGPSLDFSLKFLKENQHKVIIVSCGTTLRALLKNNIKPDLHIEMERPVEMLPIIEEVEKQQENSTLKLKDIQIVALNTVYPELLKKFKSPLLLSKVNDAGGEYIKQLDDGNIYVAPEHSNPTCPNTAVTLIISLGFKEIYLIGTDFGYTSAKHHHSKDSVYYDEEFRAKGTDQAGIDCTIKENIERKGNFRDSVFTTEVFDSSRIGIELLLAENADVNAYNCADGALIGNTKPLPIDEVSLSDNTLPKEDFLKELLHAAFDNKGFTKKNLDKMNDKTLKVLQVTLDQLLLIIDKEIDTREELADLFAAQHDLLKHLEMRKEYRFNYWLIQGTFKYLQTYIMSNCYFYSDPDKRKAFINYSLRTFRKHVKHLFIELRSSINRK